MDYIEIEYNQELKPLESVLSRVKQPGDFFVCGVIEIPMPRVEVEGAGTLSFPVPDAQIASIVRRDGLRGSDRLVFGARAVRLRLRAEAERQRPRRRHPLQRSG